MEREERDDHRDSERVSDREGDAHAHAHAERERGQMIIHMEGSRGRKRKRTSFTHKQLSDLESAFQINNNPDLKDRESLCTVTGLTEKIVRYWFQNRRQKERALQALHRRDVS